VIQNVPRINFAKWRKCYDRIQDVFQYRPPDIPKYRQTMAEVLAYLKDQLHGVSLSPIANQWLEERSIRLTREEERMRRTVLALQEVGMG
jgi:hypothetical protein